MKFLKKISTLHLFNPHRKIERFGINLVVGFSLLFFGATISFMTYHHKQFVKMMTVDSNGSVSDFSRTDDVSLTLNKIKMSKDHHHAYIPVTFSDISKMSPLAKSYKVVIWTAKDRAKILYHVKGHLVMFGPTGRAVLVLDSTEKIQSQPLLVYIINTKKIPSNTVDDVASQDKNSEYGNYDVAMFKINPGAYSIQKHADVINNLDINSKNGIGLLYHYSFGDKDIKSLQAQIKSKNSLIKKNLAIANNLITQLKLAGYHVPDAPKYLKSNWRPFDVVNVNTGKTATGIDFDNYDYDSNSDPDLVAFSDTLQNSNGSDMHDSSAEMSNETETTAGTNAAQQWSDLQTAWTNIFQAKREIYVDIYGQLSKIKHQENNIFSQTTVGKQSNVVLRSPVEVD